MADITDRQRAYAIAVATARSEVLLGLPDDPSIGIKERCSRILLAARHGGLDVRSYRLVYWIARGMV
jgi:hypothetical protein